MVAYWLCGGIVSILWPDSGVIMSRYAAAVVADQTSVVD